MWRRGGVNEPGRGGCQLLDPCTSFKGPPGTGKTWTATRLIEDVLERHPHARILVCGKEHLALDHLVAEVRAAETSLGEVSTHREGVK